MIPINIEILYPSKWIQVYAENKKQQQQKQQCLPCAEIIWMILKVSFMYTFSFETFQVMVMEHRKNNMNTGTVNSELNMM